MPTRYSTALAVDVSAVDDGVTESEADASARAPGTKYGARSGAIDLAEAQQLLQRALRRPGSVAATNRSASAFDLVVYSETSELDPDIVRGPCIALVVSGLALQTRVSRTMNRSVTSVVGPRGWLYLVEPDDHEIRVVVQRNTWLASIPTRRAEELANGDPQLAIQLMGAMSAMIEQSTSTVTGLVFKDTAGRVATLLLELERHCARRSGADLYVEHGLSQGALAQAVGASRETANKVLSEFGRRGLISVEGKSFVVRDREQLLRRSR